jgi:ectoine hydroxylase-related dioxygenase (phytanoyl-CoA dioxygenase family)
LIDVGTENGTTEFIPGTHDDECFEQVVSDVIQLSQECPTAQHPSLAVRANVSAGAAIVFDVRVLHRGLSNASMEERPMLYFTLARDWFVEEHMFTDTSIIVVDPKLDDGNAVLMDRLYQLVTGKEKRPAETEYGHPHYTDRFDLLWKDLNDDEKKRTQNMAAI